MPDLPDAVSLARAGGGKLPEPCVSGAGSDEVG
jgi:hypothetical protein